MFKAIDMSRYLNSPREADWYACPTCGDEVRVGSSGCRKCLSHPPDATDGSWPDGVDLPGDPADFDYEDWKKQEFGKSSQLKPHHLPWKYWLTGICLVAALVWVWIIAGFMQR